MSKPKDRRADQEMRCQVASIETRADADGGNVVSVIGYASSTDVAYRVGGPGGWDETIAAGSFTKTISEADDVRLLVNHEGVPLARTASGTLALSEDVMGLRADAELDAGSPAVQSLISAMERGDISEMSIGFYAHRQDWNDDYTIRIIREVELFDVSIVTYPANPATVAIVQRDAVHLDEMRSGPAPSAGISLYLARSIAASTKSRRRH